MSAENGRQIAYDDPEIGIEYPIKPVVLTDYDIHAPRLKDCDIDL